jgi:phenylacetate-CoA ligase
MPLIRYEIGDLGSLVAKECKCGRHFSLMTSPQGRDTDIIKLTNGVQLIAHYFGILFKHYSSVVDFQVRETSVDCISIYLKVNGKFRDEHKEEIINEITDYCKGGVKIKLKMVDEIPCKMVNKRRYVIGLESER